ncbi:MAG TPA: hypothetical protein VMT58_00680 [Candidatus Binataceae bacterium]|nr:hypothetical protein [Candidatus Binataceae bacterium]
MTMKLPAAAFSRRAIFIVLASVAIATAGCHPRNSARGVVDRFVDQYYLAIDLKAAEQYCTGLALDKIHQEMKLTAGQKIDEMTRKPTIHYRLTAERDSTDHVEFLFRATIEVPDAGTFEKNWMITARREGDTWMVSNFSEYDR